MMVTNRYPFIHELQVQSSGLQSIGLQDQKSNGMTRKKRAWTAVLSAEPVEVYFHFDLKEPNAVVCRAAVTEVAQMSPLWTRYFKSQTPFILD